MTSLTVQQQEVFEQIKHIAEDGSEFWMARELMPVLEYTQWRRFNDAINRSKISCEIAGFSFDKHFTHLPGKATSKGRFGDNYRLSRYACYLVAMNGDVRKQAIALAQAYFAIKTHEAEVKVPAQSKRIQELELQLAIAQANRDTVLSQERFLLRNEAIFTMHGAGQLALIQGRPEAVVTETEIVRETVMVDQNLRPVATFNGMGISEIARKLGFTGKNATAQCKNWLKSVGIKDEDWVQEMTAHATPKLPRERLPELKRLWGERKGSRQLLIGE
ncbi:MAG: hypothetical protein F6K21_06440 [Symploca sp. SIO2D2]|nr:hypothetical protein [Symploca sp. SIO2D2]